MSTPVPEVQKTPELNLFMYARRFHLTQHILRRETRPEVFNVTGIPALVLSVFASELYLKCLNMIETGRYERTHDILRLFKTLRADTQQSIATKWAKRAPDNEWMIVVMEKELGITIPRDLESILASGARAFEEMRYPDEMRKAHFGYADLPYLLEATIIEVRPVWKGIRHAPPKDGPR